MLFVLDRDPSLVIDATPRMSLGGLYYKGSTGEIYRYVYNFGADTSVSTKLATWATGQGRGYATMTDATSTDGTLGTITRVCGIWQAAVPTTKYGLLLVVSDYADVFTDGGVVDGDYLVMDGGATHTFISDTAVAGEEHGIFGQARAADVSTNVKAAINCM